MNEEIENKKSAIRSLASPELDHLPFSFVKRHATKTVQLLANSGTERSLDGQNRWFDYEFTQPVMISHIKVYCSGYSDLDKFEFKFCTPFGEVVNKTANLKSNEVESDIDEYCTAISFRPPRAWLSSTTINRVVIFGFQRNETHKFFVFASAIDELKELAVAAIDEKIGISELKIGEAGQAQTKLNELSTEMEKYNSELKFAISEIDAKNSELANLRSALAAENRQLDSSIQRKANIDAEVAISEENKRKIDLDISSNSNVLQKLKDDINIYPSEIAEFAKHSNENINLYLSYTWGPIIVLCGMFILLISGAVNLTTQITGSSDINVAALIVSRAPYVIVASAIIYASYRLIKLFFDQIIAIHNDRLNLTKISIVAKDISGAAQYSSDLNEDEKHRRFLIVKMIMLGDYIKNIVQTEPEHLFPPDLFNTNGILDGIKGPSRNEDISSLSEQ